MSSSIRKYAVFVRIIDPPEALKPGMNASVTVQVQYEPDVLLAPIQTVYSVQEQQFCLQRIGDKWETVEVEIGGDNSQMVYIKSGLNEGDDLVMNPGAYKQYMDLPEFQLESKIDLPEGSMDVGKTSTEAETAAGAAGEGPGGEAGGREGGGRRGEGGGGREGGGGGGREGGGGGGGGGAFNPAAMIDGMMSRYDSNGDGVIDADEMATLPDRAKGMIEAADGNSDGTVSKEELTSAMEKRMQEGGFGGGGGGQRGGGQ